MLPPLTIPVLCVVLIAAFMQSTFGFANAIFAMPLLMLIAGKEVAHPLVAMLSTTVAAGIVIKDWRDIHIGGNWYMFLFSLAGIPIGLLWFSQAPEFLVKAILSAIVIGFVLFRMTTIRTALLTTDRWGPVFAFAAGTLGGAYNTYGPPLVVYGTLRGWAQDQFRANMQAFFLPMGIAIVIGHWSMGLWNRAVFSYYLLSLPLVALMVLVGRWINQKISVERFYRLVYILLLCIGVSLLAQAVWGVWYASN